MQIRSIRWPEERATILTFLRDALGSAEEETIATWYGRYPGFTPDDALVIEAGPEGPIIGHGLLIPRLVRIGVAVLPAAEVALVALADAPGRAEAEALLFDALHDRLTEREDALALTVGPPPAQDGWQFEYAAGLYLTSFESEIGTGLAQRAGFWDRGHAYQRRTADQLNARNQPVTVRPFYASDLPNVQALYTAESARGRYLIERDEATWTWQLDHLISSGRYHTDDFLVAETESQLVAYVRLIAGCDVNWFLAEDAACFNVVEVAGDHPDAVEALLAEVGAIATRVQAERIGLFVPHDSPFMRHALARGATARAFTGAAALHLHNAQLALEHLAPALEERSQNSRYAGRACRLAITTEHETATLALGARGSAETIELEVPATSLVRLITGWYGIDHLSTGYHERHAGLLRVLFPQRRPMIALNDLL